MRRILVVDDSPTIRRMVLASLQSLTGVVFEEAASGLEAVELLARNTAGLMVLDLNMPDMHGLEVLRFLRSHERYRGIPVIVVTTKFDTDSRTAAINAGASAYMTKPFVPGELLAEVQRLLASE